MVTAETAVVLPVLVLVLVAALSGIAVVTAQLRCTDAAREGARAAARGENEAAVREIAGSSAPDGAAISVTLGAEHAVVRVSGSVPLIPGVGPALAVSAEATAATEPGVAGRPVALSGDPGSGEVGSEEVGVEEVGSEEVGADEVRRPVAASAALGIVIAGLRLRVSPDRRPGTGRLAVAGDPVRRLRRAGRSQPRPREERPRHQRRTARPKPRRWTARRKPHRRTALPLTQPGKEQRERGSATIWVLAMSMVVLLVGGGAILIGVAIVARHQAGAAADLAALAAAGARLEGEDRACSRAAEIAGRNGAALEDCSLDQDGMAEVSVLIEVRIGAMPTGAATAQARAGPAS